MMKTVIPFLARTDETDRRMWLAALKHALPEFRIEPFAQLTAQERDAATVAIAADPDPDDFHSLPNIQWVQSLWAGVEQIAAEFPKWPKQWVRPSLPGRSICIATCRDTHDSRVQVNGYRMNCLCQKIGPSAFSGWAILEEGRRKNSCNRVSMSADGAEPSAPWMGSAAFSGRRD